MSIAELSKGFETRILAILLTTGAMFLSFVLFMGMAYKAVAQHPETQRFWPEGVRGAVSLSFDARSVGQRSALRSFYSG